jgi:hypothetical protein
VVAFGRSLTYQSHAELVTMRSAVAAAFARIWSPHIAKTVANAVPLPISGIMPIQSALFFFFSGSVSVSQNVEVPVRAAEAADNRMDTYAAVEFSLA